MREERTMIKGKWSGVVTIKFCLTEKRFEKVPQEQLQHEMLQNFNAEIEKLIADELDDSDTVEIETQYFDLYLCDGGGDDGKDD
jgi:hypothetical protein